MHDSAERINMSQEYIEISERTVAEAITAACQKLGVPSERLEYEVIDHGKTGFLGIGARAARIRARIRKGMEESTEIDTSAIINDVLKGKKEKKKAQEPVKKDQPADNTGKEAAADNKKETAKNDSRPSGRDLEKKTEKKAEKKHEQKTEKKAVSAVEKRAEEKKTAPEGSQVQTAASVRKEETPEYAAPVKKSGKKNSSEKNQERGYRERGRGPRRHRRFAEREDEGRNFQASEQGLADAETFPAPKKRGTAPVLTDEQIEEIRQRASVFLSDVFHAMDLEAEISSTYDKESAILNIDMKGENMGVLIGKRGQTLDSLQYLVSLVVNKGIDGYIHVKADTENYRERRKKTLENLAKNIASKVKRNRTSVALEPMNPYERRIIHSALQSDRYVTTYSQGEEPYRKVIVTMKDNR
jgi:spoIIIJ-associated protein